MTRLSSVVVSWLGARWRSEGSEMDDEWCVWQSEVLGTIEIKSKLWNSRAGCYL